MPLWNPWAFGNDPISRTAAPVAPDPLGMSGHRARQPWGSRHPTVCQNLILLAGLSWSSSCLAWFSCRRCSAPPTSCGCPAFATLCSGESRAAPPGPGRRGRPGSARPAQCSRPRHRRHWGGLSLVLSHLPPDLPSLPKLLKGFPRGNWEPEGHSHQPSPSPSFSASLCWGSPPIAPSCLWPQGRTFSPFLRR